MNVKKHFDSGSLAVIGLTLALFLIALYEKGLTHDILLEAGVFLVSVKLILMSYKISVKEEALQAKLNEIHQAIQRLDKG